MNRITEQITEQLFEVLEFNKEHTKLTFYCSHNRQTYCIKTDTDVEMLMILANIYPEPVLYDIIIQVYPHGMNEYEASCFSIVLGVLGKTFSVSCYALTYSTLKIERNREKLRNFYNLTRKIK